MWKWPKKKLSPKDVVAELHKVDDLLAAQVHLTLEYLDHAPTFIMKFMDTFNVFITRNLSRGYEYKAVDDVLRSSVLMDKPYMEEFLNLFMVGMPERNFFRFLEEHPDLHRQFLESPPDYIPDSVISAPHRSESYPALIDILLAHLCHKEFSPSDKGASPETQDAFLTMQLKLSPSFTFLLPHRTTGVSYTEQELKRYAVMATLCAPAPDQPVPISRDNTVPELLSAWDENALDEFPLGVLRPAMLNEFRIESAVSVLSEMLNLPRHHELLPWIVSAVRDSGFQLGTGEWNISCSELISDLPRLTALSEVSRESVACIMRTPGHPPLSDVLDALL